MENVFKKMDRLKISTLRVSSTRWDNSGTYVVNSGEYTIYRSSSNYKDQNHNYGIAVIVN